MDNKDWPKVRKAAKKQGWTFVETKKGEMVRSPDGTWQTTVDRLHSSSDAHAVDNTVKKMKDHGFRWPAK